jgi:rubredoxin
MNLMAGRVAGEPRMRLILNFKESKVECPTCGSKAVVAKACVIDSLELLQQGTDPYEMICGEGSQAECKVCGCVFVPSEE